MIPIVIALNLIQLTSPEGGAVYVNPQTFVSMRVPAANQKSHFHSNVHCLIQVSGRTFGVAENCGAVSAKLRDVR